MNFDFTEDQRLLQQTVREFLEGECPVEQVRALWDSETGRSPELWKQLAEVGLLGALVPESAEGMGLGEVEFALLCEELGRAALAEPVVASAGVAAPLLAELGGALAERWLAPLARGEAVIAVGNEQSAFVEDAHVAHLLLLPRNGALHAVDPADARLEVQPSNDPARRVFRVDWAFDAQPAAQGARARSLLDAAFDRGTLASAAQLLGVCERLIALSVEYTGQRVQFGVPIGSFQAVKHALAGVKVKLEYARPLVYRAADSVARGLAARRVHVSMALVAAAEAARHGARVALQAHGAIGYTWEQDVHVWMRRAWSLEQAFGLPAFHRRRMADFALAPAAPLGAGHTFET